MPCDSANMKQPPPSSAETREKQSSPPKSQQLLVRSRVNLETQNVSWTMEKTQDRSHHPSLIMMNGRPSCTTAKRRMLRSVSHASKLSISSKNVEKAFISVGYKNWSDAATSGRGFDKHNQ